MDKFLPTPELKAEFEKFRALKTEQEKLDFQKARQEKLDEMTPAERQIYMTASEAGLNATICESKAFVGRAEDAFLRDRLGELPEAISLSYIARKYFGKSRNWLYQRINGYLVNGKPAAFTSDERKKFIAALQDIGDMIKKTSLSIG